MKTKDFKELKNKNLDHLKKVVGDIEKEIAGLKVENKGKNVHLLIQKRRSLAQVKTVLGEKIFTERNTNATK